MDGEDKRERIKEYMRTYYKKNREKILNYRKEYYKKFPEKYVYNPVASEPKETNRVVITLDPNPPDSIFNVVIE